MATVLPGGNLDVGLKYLDEVHRQRAEALQAQQLALQQQNSMSSQFADNRRFGQQALASNYLGGGGGGPSSRDRRAAEEQRAFQNSLALRQAALAETGQRAEIDQRAGDQNWRQQQFEISRGDRQSTLAEDARRYALDREDKTSYQQQMLADRTQGREIEEKRYGESVRRQDMIDALGRERMKKEDENNDENRKLRALQFDVAAGQKKAARISARYADRIRQAEYKLRLAEKHAPDQLPAAEEALNALVAQRDAEVNAATLGNDDSSGDGGVRELAPAGPRQMGLGAETKSSSDADPVMSAISAARTKALADLVQGKAMKRQYEIAMQKKAFFDSLHGDPLAIASEKINSMPWSDVERKRALDALPINALRESTTFGPSGRLSPPERVAALQSNAAAMLQARQITPQDYNALMAEALGEKGQYDAWKAAPKATHDYSQLQHDQNLAVLRGDDIDPNSLRITETNFGGVGERRAAALSGSQAQSAEQAARVAQLEAIIQDRDGYQKPIEQKIAARDELRRIMGLDYQQPVRDRTLDDDVIGAKRSAADTFDWLNTGRRSYNGRDYFVKR